MTQPQPQPEHVRRPQSRTMTQALVNRMLTTTTGLVLMWLAMFAVAWGLVTAAVFAVYLAVKSVLG